MTNELAKKQCIPCKEGASPLKADKLKSLHNQIESGWRIIDEHHLERKFKFKNFRQALDFTNRVGELAEEQGHHPNISLGWGMVELMIWTHKVNGLTESDFILAAKIDQL